MIPTRDDKGKPLVLEWCRAVKSTHGITAGLLPGIEPTANVSAGKGFRIHVCPAHVEPSHTAAGLARKQGGPSNYYRSFDGPRRRGAKK